MNKRLMTLVSILTLSQVTMADEFEFPACVRATGSQYVITDYVPNGNSSYTAVVALEDSTASYTVFCARGTENAKNTSTLFLIQGNGLRWDYGAANAINSKYYESNWKFGDAIALKIDCHVLFINGLISTVSKSEPVTFTADNKLVLFGAYNAESGTEPTSFSSLGKMRLYSFSVKEGDELKLDLVPCVRTSGGRSVVGLYDRVSGNFLHSGGGDLEACREDFAFANVSVSSDVGKDCLCDPEIGTFALAPSGIPMVCRAEACVDATGSVVTPVGWQLTITGSEGEKVLKSEKTNACCCVYTPQANEVVNLHWHCVRTATREKARDGYERLASFTTTGDQYLLTDYTPTGDTCVDLVVTPRSSDNQAFFCARGENGSENTYSLFSIGGGLRWDYGASDAVNAELLAPMKLNTELEISTRRQRLYLGSEVSRISKPLCADYTAGNRLVLFASYSTALPAEPTGFGSFAKVEFHSMTVSERGRIVRRYLPYRRRSDGVVGLYETVGDRFFVLAGEPIGSFVRFTPVTSRDFVDTTVKAGEDDLPDGYERVGSVETTGAQYVVTDYRPTGQSEICAKFELQDDSYNQTIFCARGAGANNSYTMFYIHDNGVGGKGIRWDYRSSNMGALDGSVKGLFDVVGLKNKVYVNGVYSSKLSRANPEEFEAGNKLVLFACYATDYPAKPTDFSALSKLRLETFAIREGIDLKVNLIPCRRSDGVVGLYDAVGKKFYPPEEGCDAFRAGSWSKSDTDTMSVCGAGMGALGSPTLPYGETRGLRPGDVFCCSVQGKVITEKGTVRCLGYLLETNDVNGVWYEWKRGTANSFFYEHPQNSASRLTWKWGRSGLVVFFQ